MTPTEAEQLLITTLKDADAWWLWDKHKYVAKLASGRCSNFFANCSPIHTQPHIQDALGQHLFEQLLAYPNDPPMAQCLLHDNVWVLGSAYGAIGMAQSIARAAPTPRIRAGYVEKIGGEGVRALSRFEIGPYPYIVLCEDVFTTGGTTRKTVKAIIEQCPDAEFAPCVLLYVNRSGWQHLTVDVMNPRTHVPLRPFTCLAVTTVKAKSWEGPKDWPEDVWLPCPLCKGTRGARCRRCHCSGFVLPEPIRPKVNWAQLQERV